MDQFFNEVKTDIDAIKNIEIITDLKKYNPYSMASIADIIICKHTTILEESFAAGKKVIFYDSEKYLQSSGYFLNENNLAEQNYEGLSKRIHEVIANDNYLPHDEWSTIKNNYFSQF